MEILGHRGNLTRRGNHHGMCHTTVERCTDTRMPMRAEKKATTPDFAGYQQLSAITWSIPPGIDTFQTTSTDEQVSRAYHIPSRRIATVAWIKSSVFVFLYSVDLELSVGP